MSIDRLILAARRLMYRHKAVLLPPSPVTAAIDMSTLPPRERETFPQCCNLPSLSRALLQPRAQVKGILESHNAVSWPGREHWNRLYSALKSERCASALRCAVFRADYDSFFLPLSQLSLPLLARSLALSELSLAPFSKFGLPLPSLPRSHLTIDWPDSQYCSQPPVRPSVRPSCSPILMLRATAVRHLNFSDFLT